MPTSKIKRYVLILVLVVALCVMLTEAIDMAKLKGQVWIFLLATGVAALAMTVIGRGSKSQ